MNPNKLEEVKNQINILHRGIDYLSRLIEASEDKISSDEALEAKIKDLRDKYEKEKFIKSKLTDPVDYQEFEDSRIDPPKTIFRIKIHNGVKIQEYCLVDVRKPKYKSFENKFIFSYREINPLTSYNTFCISASTNLELLSTISDTGNNMFLSKKNALLEIHKDIGPC